MMDPSALEPLATFCGNCDCGCPQLFVDETAPEDRRVVITDDFGQQIRMSADQFGSIVQEAKAGRLDAVAEGVDVPSAG
ncbi:hypothetical protein OHT61_29385 [Streptomyces sp. NBC_00178]|uniref:hypothetical protein n=1 Tax=Streptomyces sp. NBC_00178 TaxID=2975672 RepID=UPI002E2B2FC8|nr:hypothetical protein [Streptomyces sp. NBC_00178]